MIDPRRRWSAYGEKPDYCGLLTFGGASYTEDPAELVGVDVAVVGAPTDDLVSDRPGARLGPRAIRAAGCPPGPHLAAGVDAFEVLRVVDYGDAGVVPADPVASHAAIAQTVGEILDAGAIPAVLGGDHGISAATVKAAAERHGPLALIHFDAHTDTGETVFGAKRSHGTPMRHLVQDGHVAGDRYVQVGLRGYWPGPEVFAWQAERGIRHVLAADVRRRGIGAVLGEVLDVVGAEHPTWLSIDIDVLDPGQVPNTGTPEPGGLDTGDLLEVCRVIGRRVNLVGFEVVEVLPVALGAHDPAALAADRLVREVLTGIALKRRASA